jgi:vacuolar-type H+-ATPase subunit I/STV1
MQADFVPPSEQLITLTIGQLQDIITQAVQKAVKPLLEQLSEMEERISHLEKENAALHAKLASIEKDQDHLSNNQFTQLQIIHKLKEEAKQPAKAAPTAPPCGEKTVARIAKIAEVLKSRGPTTLKELERILQICPKEMNRLLSRLDMRRYELHARPGDAREKVLRLRVQIR